MPPLALAAIKLLALPAMLTLSGAAAATAAAEGCTVNGKAWPLCGTDNGRWSFENGRYCVARNFCPDNRTSAPTVATRQSPVDADANAKTRATFNWLRGIWGKKMIAGQTDLSWNDSIDMAERVHADTGKYPALMGFDFMDYGLTAPHAGQRQTEEAIAFANKGGLVTFHWHWRDPSLLKTAQVDKARFYVREPDAGKNTTFTIPVANGALDTASPAYRQINDGIDLVAVQLKRLSDANVTVLWRPLHEASGNNGDGWFWWGRARADGVPQAYANILLWRHMYERLVKVHGIHNLIWVWNGQDPAWYPGDDVVDIASFDIYDDTDNKTYGSQITKYRQTAQVSAEKKPIALTENSYIPDPDKMRADGAWWLWFMTWNDGDGPAGVSSPNNFWTGEHFNTTAHKRKVYNHPDVITLDKLPRF
jgi:mannan endo-1,4-beta-mannosidase